MSKEFGIDWKLYEASRVNDFLLIMAIENDLNNKRNAKHGANPKNAGNRNIASR